MAISFGERQHRCVNKLWLLQSKWSLSKHWLCIVVCGWAVIQGHGRTELPRDSKQTVTPDLITRVGQTTPIWKINNAGENLTAATSLTTSTQPCPAWSGESIIYVLLLQALLFLTASELYRLNRRFSCCLLPHLVYLFSLQIVTKDRKNNHIFHERDKCCWFPSTASRYLLCQFSYNVNISQAERIKSIHKKDCSAVSECMFFDNYKQVISCNT